MNKFTLHILINYFQEQEIIDFISNYLPIKNNIHFAIVNNGSNSIELLEDFAKLNPQISLYNANENLGYLNGANYALNQYLISNSMPDYVVLSNSDIEILNSDYSNVFDRIQNENSFDVMGPSVLSTLDLKFQNPYLKTRIAKKKIRFFSMITSNWIIYNAFLYLYYHLKLSQSKTVNKTVEHLYVYSVHGSFIVFAKTFFEKGGTLAYKCKLFCEEIYIGEQAVKLNLKVLYSPTIEILHKEHVSTGIFKKRKIVNFMHDSYKMILSKYYQN